MHFGERDFGKDLKKNVRILKCYFNHSFYLNLYYYKVCISCRRKKKDSGQWRLVLHHNKKDRNMRGNKLASYLEDPGSGFDPETETTWQVYPAYIQSYQRNARTASQKVACVSFLAVFHSSFTDEPNIRYYTVFRNWQRRCVANKK